MQRKIRSNLIGLFALVLVTGGCAEEPSTVRHSAAESQPAAMQPVDYAAWETLRLAFAPDIVVVDLWASWCVPCLERFPEMIALHRKYAGRGVQFVSLSLDDRGSPADLEFAESFLAKQQAPFPHFLLDEEILDGFEKIGIRGVPAVDVYGRDGQRAFRLTGDDPNDQFDDDDVEEAIVTLLDLP